MATCIVHQSNNCHNEFRFMESSTIYLDNVVEKILMLNIKHFLKQIDFIVISHIEYCSSQEDHKQLLIYP